MILKKYLPPTLIALVLMLSGTVYALEELCNYQKSLTHAQAMIGKGIHSLDDYQGARSALEKAKKDSANLSTFYHTKTKTSARFVADAHKYGLSTSYLNAQPPVLDALEEQLNAQLFILINNLAALIKKLQEAPTDNQRTFETERKRTADEIDELKKRLSEQTRTVTGHETASIQHQKIVADLQKRLQELENELRNSRRPAPEGDNFATRQREVQHQRELKNVQDAFAQERLEHEKALKNIQEEFRKQQERIAQDHKRAEQERVDANRIQQLGAQQLSFELDKLRKAQAEQDKINAQLKASAAAQEKIVAQERAQHATELKKLQEQWSSEKKQLEQRLASQEHKGKQAADAVQAAAASEHKEKIAAEMAQLKAERYALESQRAAFAEEQKILLEELNRQQQALNAQREEQKNVSAQSAPAQEDVKRERAAKDAALQEIKKLHEENEHLHKLEATRNAQAALEQQRTFEQQQKNISELERRNRQRQSKTRELERENKRLQDQLAQSQLAGVTPITPPAGILTAPAFPRGPVVPVSSEPSPTTIPETPARPQPNMLRRVFDFLLPAEEEYVPTYYINNNEAEQISLDRKRTEAPQTITSSLPTPQPLPIDRQPQVRPLPINREGEWKRQGAMPTISESSEPSTQPPRRLVPPITG